MSSTISSLIDQLLNQHQISLSKEQTSSLCRFVDLVEMWRKKTDLIGGATIENRLDVMLTDALILHRENLVAKNGSLVDVGAGAGAPLIPFALLRPDVRIHAVEPRRRRVTFMRMAIGSLDLADRATVLEGRDTQIDERFDVAMSRATFAPLQWADIAPRFSKRTVFFLKEPPEIVVAGSCEYRLESSDSRRIIAWQDTSM